MSGLPRQLALLDDRLERQGLLTRLGPSGTIGGRMLKERDYDQMIISQRDMLADALREADLLSADSELLHLGRILAIDVLFAEIEAQTQSFRRFVLVEDKLCRNPEARREVLGQILDYSRALRGLDVERLSELLGEELGSWVLANDDLIGNALADGDFLLLLCGDQIRPRLVAYVNHLKDQLDPLISADVALVSVAIFTNGTQHVLVPHVVGAMLRAERPITIKVMVSDAKGAPLAASMGVETGPPVGPERGRDRIELQELLDDLTKAGNDAREAGESLFKLAEDLGAETSLAGAAASVRVRNPMTRKRCTVFVVTRRATFYTGLMDRWEANAGVPPEVAREYEATLTKVLGRSPRVARGDLAGNNAIPLAEIGRHRDEVFAAIGKVIAELRADAVLPNVLRIRVVRSRHTMLG
jgi:hypothetical protein